MKCERCGCSLNFGEEAYIGGHVSKDACIAALKAKVDEKFTCEPTKQERFEHLRRAATTPPSWAVSPLTQELKDILAAFDEITDITQLGTRWYARLLEWREKWVTK